jgi:predicted metalloprotease
MAKGAQFGDSWVYLVIAHEWAHAIQYRLSKDLQTLDAELQADCLAGAVLYGAARDGTLQFEQGDEREITIGLTRLADETPWTQEGDHGDAFERIQSFALGRKGGVPACLPGA